MKKFINYLFPVRQQLNIFQLEDYKPSRYIRWIFKNYLKRNLVTKKDLVITNKIKLILFLSFFSFSLIIAIIIVFTQNLAYVLICFLILLFNPWVMFILSTIILKPYEIVNKKIVIIKTRNKILNLKKLKVIGITGSFGKTSTKEILYQLIKDKSKTLRTPESFNTVFGIAKVVDYELDESYEYFICEMAAYNPGNIEELTNMVLPKYGILTGITPQHLERFGNINNIIKTKFELWDSINKVNNFSFNLDDLEILNELKRREVENFYGYGINNKNANIKVEGIKLEKNGTSFDLIIGKQKYAVNTKLFGIPNVINIVSATSLAIKLNIDIKYLISRIKLLKPFPNRYELKFKDKSTIVDNTFSSNKQSFLETINTAKLLTGKKALITPGIVELGKQTKNIHKELGKKLSDYFDQIILVGKNLRTDSLYQGIEDKNKIVFISDNRDVYFEKIDKLVKNSFDWIFLENDVTQNY